jgi:hypothetical protein
MNLENFMFKTPNKLSLYLLYYKKLNKIKMGSDGYLLSIRITDLLYDWCIGLTIREKSTSITR